MDDSKLLKYRPLAYHHVTFATKRRKKIIAGEIRDRVHYWFDRIAGEYEIQLEERNTWLDHAHLLIYVGHGEDLSYMLNVLKGVSARRVFQEFPELKVQIGENHFWGRRFHADEVPPEAVGRVRRYIQRQEDIHLQRAGLATLDYWEQWQDLMG
jgi:putative transposase